jgi:catechol-2,3-dioxygenase
MKFKKVILHTNKLKKQRNFYKDVLGFEIVEDESESFSLRIGWSRLTFKSSDNPHIYHFCFLIPSNKLNEALRFIKERTSIIEFDNVKTHRFESWNANAFYFFDPSGNIVEFIVRHDLQNESEEPFDISHVLCVNEIGLPTSSIEQTNKQLENELGTKSWKGDFDRFGTNGDQHGLILLPNYNVKDTWFPTNQKLKPETFKAQIENSGKCFDLSFENETVQITNVT